VSKILVNHTEHAAGRILQLTLHIARHHARNDLALKGSANIAPFSPSLLHCIHFTSLLKGPTALPLESMGQETVETKETVHMVAKRIIASKPGLIPSLSHPARVVITKPTEPPCVHTRAHDS
jgi:hypothetical protein